MLRVLKRLIITYNHFFLRLVILIILMLLYYNLNWYFLREVLNNVIAKILNISGQICITYNTGNSSYMLVNGNRYSITAHCTYLDLIFITAPFCWRYQLKLFTNLTRLAGFALVVFTFNIIRIIIALYLYHKGHPWDLVHNLPDILIHIIVITLCVCLAIRIDLFRPNS